MTTGTGETRLVADIGGTNARFAWAADGRPGAAIRLRVADYESFKAALDAALAALPAQTAPFDIAIAAAGPVRAGRVKLTNAPWTIDAAVLERRGDVRAALVVNDFQAVAMALPYFTDADRAPIDAVARSDGARLPLVVLGPGTGIGVALSVPDSGGGWIPVATEGGHAELGASVLPAEIGNAIRNMVGAPIVAEDILCGDGLVRLHRAHGGTDATKGAAVVAAARDGAAPARAAIGTFVAALGAFAGDAVLHAGAFGGTYLAGGVTRALVEADLLDAGAFRSAFIDKKDYRALMASVPVAHVTFREPALLGLANAAMA